MKKKVWKRADLNIEIVAGLLCCSVVNLNPATQQPSNNFSTSKTLSKYIKTKGMLTCKETKIIGLGGCFYLQFCVILTTLFISGPLRGQIAFKDISQKVGTLERGGQNIGISICDFNKDHLEDFYVVCRTGSNHFYKNLGEGIFTEIAAEIGLDFNGNSRTAVWGDLNNDGFEEVYIGNMYEPDILYLNNGDGTFQDITKAAAIDNDGKVFSVNMADINKDGWLDIYVSNSSSDNVLYLNQGESELNFSNFTQEAGLKDTRHCMGAVFFDMDNDQDEDLYVTHDANIPNTLYENDGTGHFTEIAVQSGVAYRGFGMGVDVGDINNDGLLDLYITNLYENVLYINQGDGIFRDYTTISKVGDNGMGWGASIFDYDNDGWNDIYVGNDSYFYPLPNLLYENKSNFKFAPLDTDAEVSSMQGTYGVATGDLNNDGVQDLALANIGSKDHVQIFKNELAPNYWINFELVGITSNRSAVGTRMEIIDNRGDLHVDQVTAGNGYAGQNSKRLHFGFGNVAAIKQIKVYWPSGLVQEMEGLPLGQYYKIEEGTLPTVIDFSVTTPTEELLVDDFSIKVFPNPTIRFLQISFTNEQIPSASIKVINSLGSLIYENKVKQNRLQINLADHKGMMELVVEFDDKIVSRKILVF